MTRQDTLAVVSISGGKDSTATALLAIDEHGVDNCRFVHADTGNEHPITEAYVREYLPGVLGRPVDIVRRDFSGRIAAKRVYVETMWPRKGVPQADVDRALAVLHPTDNPFLDLCIWKGRFPSRMAQFCTQELKRRPLDAYTAAVVAEGAEVENWQGVRADESRNRANLRPTEMRPEGWEIVRPILTWTAQQVVDFVRSRGVELNALYSQGMTRVGCMPCINCSKGELAQIARRFPEHIQKIREWEALVSAAVKRGLTTFFTDAPRTSRTPIDGWGERDGEWVEPDDQLFERLRIDARVDWASTTRGGRQYDLMQELPTPSCSSVYGLCE